MPGHSAKTVVVQFRIPVDLYVKLEKRVEKRLGRWQNVNQYCRERFIYDASRKH